MLSRKGSCAAVMASPASGLERGRVRERLQAALAGLQELRLLRDRHGGMVSWALQLDREEPVTALRADPVEAEEQRLEATLAALKQQLSRLRKQDVGLKTHLQQLDQQISELKLDVSKTSSDQLESDSRPSSGFYELSDGGSCSRSNSCTSVYSECLSSSQTSLIPLSPTSCHISPPPQADVCCRRSADESPGQPNHPRATGLHLGSSRIRASAAGADQTRQRPVSTGDLERIMAQGLGCFRSTDAKKPQVCPKQKTSPLDPKFQRNLESCGGPEVYQYPSPLHAVALQSPIFFHGGEDVALALLEGQGVNGYDSLEMGYKNKTLGYIDKLLQQRTLSKNQINAGAETVETQDSYHVNLAENGNEPFEVSPKHESILSPPQTKTKTTPVNSDPKRHFMAYSSQEPSGRRSQESLRAPEMQYRYSYQAATKEYSSDEVAYSTLKKNDGPQTENPSLQRNHSDKNRGDDPEMMKPHWQRPVVAHALSTEESPSFEVQSSHTGSPEFVHAKFVPASSQRVKVRQADRKTKAVKIKRKGSDKPRVLRQQHSFSSGERTKEVGVGAKGEQKRSGKGKASERGSTWQTQEHRQRSGSDSSLYSPGLKITHKVHPKPHPVPASTKLSKNRRPQCVEYEHPVEQRKRRQAAPKWLTDANIYQAPFVQHQRSKEHHARAMENIQMVRNISSKPGHWMGPSHPFHFPMSSNSFLQSLNTRYPPAPFQMSSYYPPRCESEYSAECASLFHSTIAESSEGEMSDNTTNRFGDSESSQSSNSFSDSDSSLSLDEGDQVEIQEEEGGLVWAEAALGPTAAGQPLRQLPPRPEPSACRIKASRALKKKIRRFQPASLKVMTLV